MNATTLIKLNQIKARIEQPNGMLAVFRAKDALAKVNAYVEAYSQGHVQKIQKEQVQKASIGDDSDQEYNGPTSLLRDYGPIAELDVCGYLVMGTGASVDELQGSGICDIQHVHDAVRKAQASSLLQVLFINFNSPGGEVPGVPELADLINDLSQQILVVGYTSGVCASAAYWLYSQCTICVASESSILGAVGAKYSRLDVSKQNEMNGIDVKIYASGEYKKFNEPSQKITPLEDKWHQQSVAATGIDFISDILRKPTRTIDTANLEGQDYKGSQGFQLSFCDALAPDQETCQVNILKPMMTV